MEYIVTSRGVELTVDTAKLSDDIREKLFLHGLQQKIADAASGAKKVAEESNSDIDAVTLGMMEKALAALLAGEWSSRVAGEGISERKRVERAIMRKAVKEKFGAKSPQWAKFTGMSDDEQAKELDRWFAANAEALTPDVDAELARREEARKAKAKLSGKIEINL